MTTTTYNSAQFQPPAPVARVVLRNPFTHEQVSGVELLIDTGADISVLPVRAIERIGVEIDPDERMTLTGYDGSKTIAQLYSLDLILFRKVFRGRYVVTPDARGFLGRDVLNKVNLHLFGQDQAWAIEF